jgi:hypothetical protein
VDSHELRSRTGRGVVALSRLVSEDDVANGPDDRCDAGRREVWIPLCTRCPEAPGHRFVGEMRSGHHRAVAVLQFDDRCGVDGVGRAWIPITGWPIGHDRVI